MAGAARAETPAAAAQATDVVITCVSDTPDVEQVILGGKRHYPRSPTRYGGGGYVDHQPYGNPADC